jgi:hypothetical protein
VRLPCLTLVPANAMPMPQRETSHSGDMTCRQHRLFAVRSRRPGHVRTAFAGRQDNDISKSMLEEKTPLGTRSCAHARERRKKSRFHRGFIRSAFFPSRDDPRSRPRSPQGSSSHHSSRGKERSWSGRRDLNSGPLHPIQVRYQVAAPRPAVVSSRPQCHPHRPRVNRCKSGRDCRRNLRARIARLHGTPTLHE